MRRSLRPRILLAGAALLGGFGRAGRAVQFQMTWRYSQALQARVEEEFARAPKVSGRPYVMVLTARCVAGASHSTYVVAPADALNARATESVMNARSASARLEGRIRILTADAGAKDTEADIRIDCQDLAERPVW